jgi:hypothetical protein
MSGPPSVAPHVKNIVDNLKAIDPRLKDVADWRIDHAHRHYSSSEDFGDDTKVFDWLPEDTVENSWDYIQSCQIPDLWRTIRELEKFNLEQSITIRDLRKEIKTLKEGH